MSLLCDVDSTFYAVCQVDLIISNPLPPEQPDDTDDYSYDDYSADDLDYVEESDELAVPEAAFSTEELFELSAQVTNEFQAGDISAVVGIEVESLVVEEPPLPPESPEWQEQQENQYNDVSVSHSATNRTVLK